MVLRSLYSRDRKDHRQSRDLRDIYLYQALDQLDTWFRLRFDHYLTSRDGGLLISSLVIFVAVVGAAFRKISLFGWHQFLANEPQERLQQ